MYKMYTEHTISLGRPCMFHLPVFCLLNHSVQKLRAFLSVSGVALPFTFSANQCLSMVFYMKPNHFLHGKTIKVILRLYLLNPHTWKMYVYTKQ
jgi:hypothetical protein